MKNDKLNFKALFLLLTFFILVNSCKKEPDDNLSNDSQKLKISHTEALPFQLIELQLEFGEPVNVNSETNVMKVGDSIVIAYRTPNKDIFAYYLLLPELAPGNYTITMQTPNGDATAEINIKPYIPITDVNKYLIDYNTKLNTEYSEISQEYDNKVQDGKLRQGTADSLKDFVSKSYNESSTMLAQLSEIEKKKFAYMYEANKSWLNEFKIAIANHPLVQGSKRSTDDPCESIRQSHETYLQSSGSEEYRNQYLTRLQDCEAQQTEARLEAEKKFNGKINAAYNEAKEKFDSQDGKISGSIAFVKTFLFEAAKGIFETATGITDLDDPFAPLRMDDPEKRTAYSFTADVETYFSAGVTFTNLNRQDANISPDFIEMISNIDYHNQTMVNIGKYLPYVPLMAVPTNKTEKRKVWDYTIDEISNTNITVQISEDMNGKKVKFVPKNITTPSTNFTFRIHVKTEYGEVYKTISATLELPLDKVLISGSPWKITQFVNDGENFFEFNPSETPPFECQGVEYQDEFKWISATMSFINGGSGSLYTKSENIKHKFTFDGSDCEYNGTQNSISEETHSMGWTFNSQTNVIKIPLLVNDDEDEFEVTVDKGIISLKGLYMQIILQKP